MEPLLIILVPGILGGIVMALLLATRRIAIRQPAVERRLEPPSPTLINMAHIRVEGVGGLGMVAAVVAVAVVQPQIRLAMVIAAVLGVGLALLLIVLRRRTPPDRADGDPGAHSMLGIEKSTPRADRAARPNRPARFGSATVRPIG